MQKLNAAAVRVKVERLILIGVAGSRGEDGEWKKSEAGREKQKVRLQESLKCAFDLKKKKQLVK